MNISAAIDLEADFLQGARSTLTPQEDPVYRMIMAHREPGKLLASMRAAWPEGKILRVQLKQTSYNPYSRARLVAELLLDEPDAEPHVLSLKVFSTPERAAEIYTEALNKRMLPTPGPSVMLLGDGHTVAWWLPNGQNLKKLRVCFDRNSFARFIVKSGLCDLGAGPYLPELLRYVPRRRALFRWLLSDGRNVYLKFYEEASHKNAARNLALLNETPTGLGFRVPRLLSYNKRRRTVIMDEVPGVQLTTLLPDAEPELFKHIGQALAQLHASALQPTARHSPEMELKALIVAMAEIKNALPLFASQLDALVNKLARACPACPHTVPVHANLFGDQILVAGNQIGIVDWDDLARGDPFYDVGRLAAHLIYISLCGQVEPARTMQYLDALLSAYALDHVEPIDYERLHWHVAVALLMRAKISALRPLPQGWAKQIGDAIVAAQLVLEGRWLP